MAKICIFFHLPYNTKKFAAYYDQLIGSLKKNHKLLIINFIDINYQDEFCNQKIKDFNPDLIISFNHAINEYIYNNTNCFVLVVEADLYPNGFFKIDLMSKYSEKIYIATANNNLRNRIKKLINFLDDNKFIILKNSTSFLDYESKHKIQDINISFIGTILGIENNKFVNFLTKNINNRENLDYAKNLITKAKYNIHQIAKDEFNFFNTEYSDLFNYISYLNRIKPLESIADLGLVIYGKAHNLNNIASSEDLIFCINELSDILSAIENKEIYDRSKLSINLHFAHNSSDPNLSSYSWRVTDIMASNSCLVSTFCPALDQDFGKWVKIPQFSNKNEAYEVCKKLLLDDAWRIDVVEGSKIAIRDGGFTFNDRLLELEKFFNLKRNDPNFLDNYNFFINKKISDEVCKKLLLDDAWRIDVAEGSKNYKAKLFKIFQKKFKRLFKNIVRIVIKLNIERIIKLPLKLIKIIHGKS